jgi:hypothetical protein
MMQDLIKSVLFGYCNTFRQAEEGMARPTPDKIHAKGITELKSDNIL